MKAVTVRCVKAYDGLHVGDEITAIYAPTPRKMLYHIASKPISDKKFNEHFEIVIDDNPHPESKQ